MDCHPSRRRCGAPHRHGANAHRRQKIDEHHINKMARGWTEIRQRLVAFTPERVAAGIGIDAKTIRRLAREFADAPTSVVYSRIGACNNRFGTIATWATDLLNLVAGRMGEVGGAMLPTPAINVSALSPYFNDGYGALAQPLAQTS